VGKTVRLRRHSTLLLLLLLLLLPPPPPLQLQLLNAGSNGWTDEEAVAVGNRTGPNTTK
jgi:hypothetical protein